MPDDYLKLPEAEISKAGESSSFELKVILVNVFFSVVLLFEDAGEGVERQA